MDANKAHYVTATAIIVRDGKYLIAKRSDGEKVFPGLWTVPGGKLEVRDYASRPKDTKECWYNVLEDVVKREVREETGLEIDNIDYVTSIVFIRPDNIPALIVSLSADYASGEVKLSEELVDHAWVSLEEAKKFEFIDGIFEELEMLDSKLKGRKKKWERLK